MGFEIEGKRLFMQWSDGSWTNSLNDDFVKDVIDLTEKLGQPIKVEVRYEKDWITETV